MNENVIIIVSPDNNSGDTSVVNKINKQFLAELDFDITLPETIFKKIHHIMYRNGLDIPIISKFDIMGDELILEVEQIEPNINPGITQPLYLYIIYYLTDNKNYDVFAELIDENEVNTILSSLEELEDTENPSNV